MENLLAFNIIVIIFYLLVEKLKINDEIKKYTLYPLRAILVVLIIVDLLTLFGVLSPFF